MREVLWITFDWPLLVFLLAVAASLVVIFKVGRALGLIILALVIYNATVWIPWWGWIPEVFAISVIAGFAGVLWGLISGGGRLIAVLGGCASLGIALVLAISSAFSVPPQVAEDTPVVTDDVEKFESGLEAERNDRIMNDGEIRQDLDKLVERVSRLEGGK